MMIDLVTQQRNAAIAECERIIEAVEKDSRYRAKPANVFSNAPLALIQVELKVRRATAKKILTSLKE